MTAVTGGAARRCCEACVVDPPLKVGRVPFGRTVLVLQLIAALTFLGYTLAKKDVQLPFSSEPYRGRRRCCPTPRA